MPEPIEELYVVIGSDISKLLKETKEGVDRVEKQLKGFGDTAEKQTKKAETGFEKFKKQLSGLGASFKVLGTLAAAAFAVLVKVGKESIELYRQQAAAEAQLAAAIKSTGGAAGLTAKELKQLASELQNTTNFGDEATIGAESLLLTFTRVGKEVFPRALKSILDVSVAMKQDLKSSAVQVGKALNDPIKGLGMLSRVGIQFTEQQKEQIKTLTESGDLIGAQTVILAELERQFGGSAEAAREADGGFQAAANAVGDLKERIGEGLLPATSQYNDIVIEAAEGWIKALDNIGLIQDALGEAAGTGKDVLPDEEVKGFSAAMLLITDPTRAAGIAVDRTRNLIQGLVNPLADAGTNALKAVVGEEKLKDAFAKVAAEADAAEGDITGFNNAVTNTVQVSEAAAKVIDSYGSELLDLQESTAEKSADLEKKHTEELTDIQDEYSDSIADAEKKRSKALADAEADRGKAIAEAGKQRAEEIADLEKDIAKQRGDVIEGTRKDLAKLEKETDRALKEEQDTFNRDELRETEDHLNSLRQLRQQYLDNIDNAVKNRDARALVDARKQYQQEKAQQEDTFKTNQSRAREDQDLRLQQIREEESRRAEEIMTAQAEELQNLIEAEAEKRAEIEKSYSEQLQKADEAYQESAAKAQAAYDEESTKAQERRDEQLQKEQENYDKEKEQIDQQIAERLEQIAKGLADQDEITDEEAQNILETFAKYFGVDGEIDKLMADFANRRAAKLAIEVQYTANGTEVSYNPGSSSMQNPYSAAVPSFASGGSMFANKPTMVQFGEVPEVATFTPLSKMGGGPQRMEIDLKMSGSAPPGIRSGDRDQIAGVLLNALQEAGFDRASGGRGQ